MEFILDRRDYMLDKMKENFCIDFCIGDDCDSCMFDGCSRVTID